MCRLGLGNFIMRLGLDCMNDIRKFDCVLDEKNGNIIADKIPITLRGIELHREAANIPDGIL